MFHQSLTFTLGVVLASSLIFSGCDKLNQYSEQELIQRAKDFEDKGNLKASIIELKNALQKNPNNPQARLLLGQIYLKNGMGHEAEKELSQAEKLGVSHESIQIDIGEALLLMGEYSRVLNEIQPTEKTTPPNLAYIQQLHADALLRQGKIKEACNLFQQSLNTHKGHAPTFWGLAQCAMAERNPDKAREWLNTALSLKNKQAKTWIFLGNLEQFQKNSKKSLAAYSQALRLEPNNLEALLNRAALYMALRQPESARADVEKVSRIAPRAFTTYYLQALLHFEFNKFAEARDTVQKALQIAPDHMPSILLAGATAYSLGSYNQAESYLNRFLARFSNHDYARKILAATQLKQKHPEKALQTLAPVLTAHPDDAAALALSGEAYMASGEPAKAIQLLQKASTIETRNPKIRTQLALSHLAIGADELGITELARAASLDPGPQKADILLVILHLKSKEYDKALQAIAALEKKLPNNAITYNLKAAALLGKQDRIGARRSFEQALAIDAKLLPAAINLARMDMQDKKPDLARRRIEAILEKDKNNLTAMMVLADIAATQKQVKEYVSWLEKAAKADPKAIEPRAELVRHYLSNRDNQKALALALETSNIHPDSLQAMYLLGATQMSTGKNMEAVVTFSRATQKVPQSPEVYLSLALAQGGAKQIDAARNSLKKAIQLKPDYLKAQDTLMRLELSDKKPEVALQIARQIQSKQPKSPLGFDREGDIQLSQKRFSQAIKAYEQALEKGAGTAGLMKLHRAISISGNTRVADKKLASWIRQYPKDLAARNYAAEVYLRTNRPREAIAQYEELLKADPNNVAALNNVANLYQGEKDIQSASTTAERAFKLAPEHPGVQDTLGWILVEQGQLPRAIPLLSKAAAKLPMAGTIRYHYGVALARSGKKAEAKKELEAAIAKDPKFPELEDAKVLLKSL